MGRRRGRPGNGLLATGTGSSGDESVGVEVPEDKGVCVETGLSVEMDRGPLRALRSAASISDTRESQLISSGIEKFVIVLGEGACDLL
jgi:hypothetical protein